MAPTVELTPDPTQSNADIDECKADIIGYNEIRVDWSDGYQKNQQILKDLISISFMVQLIQIMVVMLQNFNTQRQQLMRYSL